MACHGARPWAGVGVRAGDGVWVQPEPGGHVPPHTHRGAQELAPVRAQVEDNPSPGAGQGGPPDQQDEEDDVGQRGRHPHHLERGSPQPPAPAELLHQAHKPPVSAMAGSLVAAWVAQGRGEEAISHV